MMDAGASGTLYAERAADPRSPSFLFQRLPAFTRALAKPTPADPVHINLQHLATARSPVHAVAAQLATPPTRLGIVIQPSSTINDVERHHRSLVGDACLRSKPAPSQAKPAASSATAQKLDPAKALAARVRAAKPRVDSGRVRRRPRNTAPTAVQYRLVRPGTGSTVSTLGNTTQLRRTQSQRAMSSHGRRTPPAGHPRRATTAASSQPSRRVQGWGIWAAQEPARDVLLSAPHSRRVPKRALARMQRGNPLLRPRVHGRQPCLSPTSHAPREDACFKFRAKRFPEIPPSSDVPPACGFFKPTCSEDMGPGRYVLLILMRHCCLGNDSHWATACDMTGMILMPRRLASRIRIGRVPCF